MSLVSGGESLKSTGKDCSTEMFSPEQFQKVLVFPFCVSVHYTRVHYKEEITLYSSVFLCIVTPCSGGEKGNVSSPFPDYESL